MMIDFIYLIAVFFGCAAALHWRDAKVRVRNRTALLLVISAGIAAVLPLMGIPFDPLLWASIDLGAVIIPLLRPQHSVSDALIVAIFVAIWPTYLSDDPTAIALGTALVIVQFMLALGVPTLMLRMTRKLRIQVKPNGPLEMLAA